MKNITIRQMRIFESVSRHLSFSRAAEDLHLTQPAVSMQIRQMEDHAGQPLFLHAGKRISLTDAGEIVLCHCRAILADVKAAEVSLSALANKRTQLLRIGLITSASYAFPRIVNAFLGDNTSTKLHMTVRSRDQLIGSLRNEEIDLAVMIHAPDKAAFVTEPFARIPFVLVASSNHVLAGETDIPLSRLADECMIVREIGTDTRNVADDLFRDQRAKPSFMELGCEEAIKQSVIAGIGVSLLSAQAVQSEVRSGLMKILDVQGFPLERQWQVSHRADRTLPPAAREFREYLLTEGRALLTEFVGMDNVHAVVNGQRSENVVRPTVTMSAATATLNLAARTRELLRTDALASGHHTQNQEVLGRDDYRLDNLAERSKRQRH